MATYLLSDPDTREVRLIFADTFRGEHLRTAYRVVGHDRLPLRDRPDLDRRRAYQTMGGWYIRQPVPGGTRHSNFQVEPRPVLDTRIPCPRAAGADGRRRGRARCAWCTDDAIPLQG
jgi:hypothetical protein